MAMWRVVAPQLSVLLGRNSITKIPQAGYATGATAIGEIVELLGLHKNKLLETSKFSGKYSSPLDSASLKVPTPVPVVRKDASGRYMITEETPFDNEKLERRAQEAAEKRKSANMMAELRNFMYYPPRIQKWVSYARMTKGFYNSAGYWRNVWSEAANEIPKRQKLAEEGRQRELDKEVIEAREQMIRDNPLPPDLVGKYRFGVQAEEAAGLNPKLREFLTFRHANNMEINQYRKDQAMLKWQTKPYDTGTTGVQIAVLTTRINYLTAHLTRHKGDVVSKLGLRDLINKRHKLMKYCKRKNVPLYYDLIKELNIKDMA